MPDSELLGIGSFAMLTGLSIPALRHYDDVGVLAPAVVDDRSGYRRYRRDQVDRARLIGALRAVDLPLREIQLVLDDPTGARAVLEQHRDRLAERAQVVADQLSTIDEFIAKGVPVPKASGNRMVMVNIPVDDLEASRRFYSETLDVEFCEERHGDGPVHLNAAFGQPNTVSWFLLALWKHEEPGTADIGFLVDDLDDAYARAIDAGAQTVYEPKTIEGMPRNAMLKDPSGNLVGLYQS
jgi:DNA-binding transcriptional MerR regulator